MTGENKAEKNHNLATLGESWRASRHLLPKLSRRPPQEHPLSLELAKARPATCACS
ncbi:hypothetical protein A2U01_0065319 [Trifolium medium]|uniref:Uncharacterized protein n=1 Tax=Trifolium medium TaxID=97028 RepID=A0A392S7Y3_9FABA|nr:hypothetical protein [Trifolium medium]